MIDFQYSQLDGKTLIQVSLSGRLTQREYAVFKPHFESEIRHYTNLRLLFDLDNSLSWDPRSCWRFLRFDSRNRSSIHKLAIIGPAPNWHRWLWAACRPLKVGQALPFTANQRPTAFAWVKA